MAVVCRPVRFLLPLLALILPLLFCLPVSAGARWQRMGPDGAGVTRDLVIDPMQSDVLYLVAGAGVYKSINGAGSWEPAWRGLAGAGVSSLSIDPGTTSTLYALSAEGVFKSTDGAGSWFPANCGLSGQMRDLDIDSVDTSTLYVASDLGVFKTTDGGSSWALSNAGLTNLDVRAVAVAPSNPSVVYAGTLGGGVFQSFNGGVTWQAANTGLPDLRVVLLEVDPLNEQVAFVSTLGPSGALLRTTNGGGSWQPSSSGLEGGSPSAVAFDPQNPNILYAGQVLDGIFKSSNGGVSWSQANNGVTQGLADFGIVALAVDPGNSLRVYAATLDGGPGVFRSLDAGGSWSPANQGLDIHRALDIVFDPVDSQTLYAVMDDRNALYKSTDGGDTWQRMVAGFRDELGLFQNLGLSLAADPNNRMVLYLGSNGDGLFRTSNGGVLWERVTSPVFEGTFVTVVRVDPTDSNVIYAATAAGGVVRSSNSGATWSNTGGQITGLVEDIEVDPSQSPRIYALVGTADGVFRTTNSGNNWSVIASGLDGAVPSDLLIDLADATTLYLSTREDGVFRSRDRGDSWTAVNQGLGDLRVLSLAAGPGALYAGTRAGGVYRSRDGGETWSLAARGLDNQAIGALAVDPGDPDTVYAGPDFQSVVKRVGQPAYLYTAGRVDERPQFDGLAFSNFSLEAASLQLEQIGAIVAASESGLPQQSPAGASIGLDLPSGQQVAQTRTQIFPGSGSGPAWLELLTDVTELASFFQFGSSDLAQLDGGVAVEEPLTSFLFTRVFEGAAAFRGQSASTRLSIFNPNDSAVRVRLSYFPLGGPPGPPARQISRDIPARSFLEGSFAELFETGSLGGYVLGEVVVGGPVAAFQLIQLPEEQTILGLNAASLDRPGRAHSAQLASQADIFTNVNLVNASSAERLVTLAAVDENGAEIGVPSFHALGPGEQLSMDAGALFSVADAGSSPAQAAGFVGSLIVEADGEGVVGDVIFGDPDRLRFAAALPLQSEAFTDAVFSQVANLPGFFTGLALFHPGSPFESACATQPADVEIEVFRANGQLAGRASLQLTVGQRLSQLVPQLVPATAGQAGGYIRIRSSRPLIAQMLFGALDGQGIRLFSAVPPAVVR